MASTIERTPLEIQEMIISYLAPDDPNQWSLFSRVHFYFAPKHVQQLAELSSNSFFASWVKEVVFHKPMLLLKHQDRPNFDQAVQIELQKDRSLGLKPVIKKQPHQSDYSLWIPYPTETVEKGDISYFNNLQKQQSLINSGVLPRKWGKILKSFTKLQKIVYAEPDRARCVAEAHKRKSHKNDYSWCDCQEERYGSRWKTTFRTPTERLYPGILLQRLPHKENVDDHQEQECLLQIMSSLAKAQIACHELHIGPGIKINTSGQRIWDEDWALALSHITKFDYNPSQVSLRSIRRTVPVREESDQFLTSLLELMPSLVELNVRRCDGLNMHVKYTEDFSKDEENEGPTLQSLRKLEVRNSRVALDSLNQFLQLNNCVKHISLQDVSFDRRESQHDIAKDICDLFKTIHDQLKLETFSVCGLRIGTNPTRQRRLADGFREDEDAAGECHLRPELFQYALRQREWKSEFENMGLAREDG
ncbi:MAG: hypothetical protein M1831_003083 [Alyxoria varia]|nr:MAG: hypothetical protein M1831_003083 [Alyxoria varia]